MDHSKIPDSRNAIFGETALQTQRKNEQQNEIEAVPVHPQINQMMA
jgi:hypothetical protein